LGQKIPMTKSQIPMKSQGPMTNEERIWHLRLPLRLAAPTLGFGIWDFIGISSPTYC
jgi:hypothetical protein